MYLEQAVLLGKAKDWVKPETFIAKVSHSWHFSIPPPELLPLGTYNHGTAPLFQKHWIFSLTEMCTYVQLHITDTKVKTVCLESNLHPQWHSHLKERYGSEKRVLTLKLDLTVRLVLLWVRGLDQRHPELLPNRNDAAILSWWHFSVCSEHSDFTAIVWNSVALNDVISSG